jgi:hypothetical protein
MAGGRAAKIARSASSLRSGRAGLLTGAGGGGQRDP